MFSYRDPTGCYGDHNVDSYPQNVDESEKLPNASGLGHSSWSMHTSGSSTHSSPHGVHPGQGHPAHALHSPPTVQYHYQHHHSGSAGVDSYGYPIPQVQVPHKETDPMMNKDLMRSSSPPPPRNAAVAAAAATWQNNRSRTRYPAGGAFLPYQTHYDGPPLETNSHMVHGPHGNHSSHGHSIPRKQSWPSEGPYPPNVPSGQFPRDGPPMMYSGALRGNVSSSIIRHTSVAVTGMETRNLSAHPHQGVPQHIHQQQSSLLQHQQEHSHQLLCQLVQKERDAHRLPGYQDSRHPGVRNHMGYHDIFPQHQHHQYCNSQEMLRKGPLPMSMEGDRRSAFTARQAPYNHNNWNKNSVPFLPLPPPHQMLPAHRGAPSAFQPCNKPGEPEMYPDGIMWSKSGQMDHGSHIQMTGPGWMHNPQSQMFLSRQMNKQSLANNNSSMMGLDTCHLGAHTAMQGPGGRQSGPGGGMPKGNAMPAMQFHQQQHLDMHNPHVRAQVMHQQHPSSQQSMQQPQIMSSPMSNSQHSPMVSSPHNSIHSPHIATVNPCSQQQSQLQQPESLLVAGEDNRKESDGSSRSLRNCLDVRQFLASWNEDADVGTPRPCVDEGEATENMEQPPDMTEEGALVVLDCRSLPREEAANLLTMYPGINLNQVSGAEGLISCTEEGMFNTSTDTAQGVLQNLLDSACGTSSGSNSTSVSSPVISPSGQSGARSLDMLLNSALPTPPASQEHNMVQTNLPLSTPVPNTAVGLSSPLSSHLDDPIRPSLMDASGFGMLSPTSPAISLKFTSTTVNTPFVRFPPTDDPPSVVQVSKEHHGFNSTQQYLNDKEETDTLPASTTSGVKESMPLLFDELDTPCPDVSRAPSRSQIEIAPSPALSDASTESKVRASLRSFRKRKLNSPDRDIHDSFDSHSQDALDTNARNSSSSSLFESEEAVERSKWAFAQISANAKSSCNKSSTIKSPHDWEPRNLSSLENAKEKSASNFDQRKVNKSTASVNCSIESQKSDSTKFDKSTSPTIFLTHKDTQTEETRNKRKIDPSIFNDTFAQTSVRCIQDEIQNETYVQTSVQCLQDEIHKSSINESLCKELEEKLPLHQPDSSLIENASVQTEIDAEFLIGERVLQNTNIKGSNAGSSLATEAAQETSAKPVECIETSTTCITSSMNINKLINVANTAVDSRTGSDDTEIRTSNLRTGSSTSDAALQFSSSTETNQEVEILKSTPKTGLNFDTAEKEIQPYLNNENSIRVSKEELSSSKKTNEKNRSIGTGTEDQYLSRIVDTSPGNIPKILLSRLREKSSKTNGVIKRLPSIRLTRVCSPMSSCGSDPEYICSVSDSEMGTPTEVNTNTMDSTLSDYASNDTLDSPPPSLKKMRGKHRHAKAQKTVEGTLPDTYNASIQFPEENIHKDVSVNTSCLSAQYLNQSETSTECGQIYEKVQNSINIHTNHSKETELGDCDSRIVNREETIADSGKYHTSEINVLTLDECVQTANETVQEFDGSVQHLVENVSEQNLSLPDLPSLVDKTQVVTAQNLKRSRQDFSPLIENIPTATAQSLEERVGDVPVLAEDAPTETAPNLGRSVPDLPLLAENTLGVTEQNLEKSGQDTLVSIESIPTEQKSEEIVQDPPPLIENVPTETAAKSEERVQGLPSLLEDTRTESVQKPEESVQDLPSLLEDIPKGTAQNPDESAQDLPSLLEDMATETAQMLDESVQDLPSLLEDIPIEAAQKSEDGLQDLPSLNENIPSSPAEEGMGQDLPVLVDNISIVSKGSDPLLEKELLPETEQAKGEKACNVPNDSELEKTDLSQEEELCMVPNKLEPTPPLSTNDHKRTESHATKYLRLAVQEEENADQDLPMLSKSNVIDLGVNTEKSILAPSINRQDCSTKEGKTDAAPNLKLLHNNLPNLEKSSFEPENTITVTEPSAREDTFGIQESSSPIAPANDSNETLVISKDSPHNVEKNEVCTDLLHLPASQEDCNNAEEILADKQCQEKNNCILQNEKTTKHLELPTIQENKSISSESCSVDDPVEETVLSRDVQPNEDLLPVRSPVSTKASPPSVHTVCKDSSTSEPVDMSLSLSVSQMEECQSASGMKDPVSAQVSKFELPIGDAINSSSITASPLDLSNQKETTGLDDDQASSHPIDKLSDGKACDNLNTPSSVVQESNILSAIEKVPLENSEEEILTVVEENRCAMDVDADKISEDVTRSESPERQYSTKEPIPIVNHHHPLSPHNKPPIKRGVDLDSCAETSEASNCSHGNIKENVQTLKEITTEVTTTISLGELEGDLESERGLSCDNSENGVPVNFAENVQCEDTLKEMSEDNSVHSSEEQENQDPSKNSDLNTSQVMCQQDEKVPGADKISKNDLNREEKASFLEIKESSSCEESFVSKLIAVQVEDEFEISTADKDTQSSSDDNFTLSDEERAFPDPQEPNFDVTQIPLPDECIAIKNRIFKARSRKRRLAQREDNNSPTSSLLYDLESFSIDVQCKVQDSKRMFGFRSRASQTHKIKMNSPPCEGSNQCDSHDSQTLMEVVEEVSKVLHEGESTVNSSPRCVDNVLLDMPKSPRSKYDEYKEGSPEIPESNCVRRQKGRTLYDGSHSVDENKGIDSEEILKATDILQENESLPSRPKDFENSSICVSNNQDCTNKPVELPSMLLNSSSETGTPKRSTSQVISDSFDRSENDLSNNYESCSNPPSCSKDMPASPEAVADGKATDTVKEKFCCENKNDPSCLCDISVVRKFIESEMCASEPFHSSINVKTLLLNENVLPYSEETVLLTEVGEVTNYTVSDTAKEVPFTDNNGTYSISKETTNALSNVLTVNTDSSSTAADSNVVLSPVSKKLKNLDKKFQCNDDNKEESSLTEEKVKICEPEETDTKENIKNLLIDKPATFCPLLETENIKSPEKIIESVEVCSTKCMVESTFTDEYNQLKKTENSEEIPSLEENIVIEEEKKFVCNSLGGYVPFEQEKHIFVSNIIDEQGVALCEHKVESSSCNTVFNLKNEATCPDFDTSGQTPPVDSSNRLTRFNAEEDASSCHCEKFAGDKELYFEARTCEKRKEKLPSSLSFRNVHLAIGKSMYRLSSEWQTINFGEDQDDANTSMTFQNSKTNSEMNKSVHEPNVFHSEYSLDNEAIIFPKLAKSVGSCLADDLASCEKPSDPVQLATASQDSSEDELPPLDAPGLEADTVAADSDSDREMPCLQPEPNGQISSNLSNEMVTPPTDAPCTVTAEGDSTAVSNNTRSPQPTCEAASPAPASGWKTSPVFVSSRAPRKEMPTKRGRSPDSQADSDTSCSEGFLSDASSDSSRSSRSRSSSHSDSSSSSAGRRRARRPRKRRRRAASSGSKLSDDSRSSFSEDEEEAQDEGQRCESQLSEAKPSRDSSPEAAAAGGKSEEKEAEEETPASEEETPASEQAALAEAVLEAVERVLEAVDAGILAEVAVDETDQETPIVVELLAEVVEEVAENVDGEVEVLGEAPEVVKENVAEVVDGVVEIESVVEVAGSEVVEGMNEVTAEVVEAVEEMVGIVEAVIEGEAEVIEMQVVQSEFLQVEEETAQIIEAEPEAAHSTTAVSAEADGGEAVGRLEISDIRSVANDLAEWSSAGGDVVPVHVDSVHNWPYVEEVFSTEEVLQEEVVQTEAAPEEGLEEGCDTVVAADADGDADGDAHGDADGSYVRPQLRCSLSLSRILMAGEDLVLGPAKVAVRPTECPARSPSSGLSDAHCERGRSRAGDRWKVVDREESIESVGSNHSYTSLEENNNHLPGTPGPPTKSPIPGPVIKVSKLILKRPSEREHSVTGTSPDGGSALKTKGALKSYQIESGRSKRGSRRSGSRGSHGGHDRRRWYSQLSPSPACYASHSSPRAGPGPGGCAPDSEVPKVIIKRQFLPPGPRPGAGDDPGGGAGTGPGPRPRRPRGPQSASWEMQPVVVLRRDPAVDAMALSRRSRRSREHRHSGPRKRSRSERDRERGRERGRDRERSHPLQILAEVAEAEGLEEEAGPVKRRKKWSSLSHDVDPSYRDRHRTEEGLGAGAASSDHLHVMELVKRWRQVEPQATPSGQDTPMPHSSPGLGLDLAPVATEEGPGSPGLGPLAPPTALPPEEPLLAAAPSLHRCEACGEDLNDADEKASHIKLHPYHCQRCYQAFASQNDFVEHLKAVHPNTRQLHHCLLCLKTFPTERQHAEHMRGWSHCHMERAQRRTIHTLFRMFTGSDCPRLNPLSPEEKQLLDWFPNDPGVIHFYHQATPLQLATEERPLHRGSMCGQSSSGKDQTHLE